MHVWCHHQRTTSDERIRAADEERGGNCGSVSKCRISVLQHAAAIGSRSRFRSVAGFVAKVVTKVYQSRAIRSPSSKHCSTGTHWAAIKPSERQNCRSERGVVRNEIIIFFLLSDYKCFDSEIKQGDEERWDFFFFKLKHVSVWKSMDKHGTAFIYTYPTHIFVFFSNTIDEKNLKMSRDTLQWISIYNWQL